MTKNEAAIVIDSHIDGECVADLADKILTVASDGKVQETTKVEAIKALVELCGKVTHPVTITNSIFKGIGYKEDRDNG